MKRAGYTLSELLVALALAGLVGSIAAALLQSQSGVARRTAERARRNEALRTASHVLTSELRWLNASDVRSLSSDSIALRAFRGSAVVCALAGSGALVRYRGVRLPDATKDSLLVLRDTVFEARAALLAAAPQQEGCSAGADQQLQHIAASAALQVGDVLAFFESGSYYLSGNALRYRLGAEGRQPVTAELFDDRDTQFALLSGSYAQARLSTRSQANAPRLQAVIRLVLGGGS